MSGTRPVARLDIAHGILLPHWIEDPHRHADLVGMRVIRAVEPGEVITPRHLAADHTTILDSMVADDCEPLAALDHRVFDLLGNVFSDVPWDVENYSRPVNRKEELSFVVRAGSDPVACWIATQTVPGDAHTHRVVVAPEYRGQGLFQRLFCASWRATLYAGLRRMLGETQESNTTAIRAYLGVGLRVMTGREVREYLRARDRRDRVEGHVIVDDQGNRAVGIVSTPEHGLEGMGSPR